MGRATSARPSASICRSPPESWWPALFRRRASGSNSVVDLGRRPRARSGPRHSAAEPQVLVDRQLGDDAAALGDVGEPAPDAVLDADRRRGPARRGGCCPRVSGDQRGRGCAAGWSCRRRWRRRARRCCRPARRGRRRAAPARRRSRRSGPAPPGARSRGASPRSPRYASSTAGSPATSSGVPRRDHPAEVEDDDAVAHAHDEVDVVLDQQHGAAGGGGVPDQVAERGDVVGAEAAGGLVEQEQARLRDERPGERDLLLLGVGQVADGAVGVTGEVERVELALRVRAGVVRRRGGRRARSRGRSGRGTGRGPGACGRRRGRTAASGRAAAGRRRR